MNGSYNVAEKVLDYWFTIEFLAQDKFPVQGLDSKKAIKEAKEGKSKRKTLSHFLLFDNNTVDTVYETIISEVEKCGMKCWSSAEDEWGIREKVSTGKSTLYVYVCTSGEKAEFYG